MPDLTLSTQDLNGDDAITGSFGFDETPEQDLDGFLPEEPFTADDEAAMEAANAAWEAETAALQAAYERRPVRAPLPTLPAAVLAATPRDALRDMARMARKVLDGFPRGLTTRRYRRIALAAAVNGFHEARAGFHSSRRRVG